MPKIAGRTSVYLSAICNTQCTVISHHLPSGRPSKYYAGQYEFQCLHGMGEPLYEQVVGSRSDNKLGIPCRIYAPVGNHETLLAYLVRRLLENGANTSFVNRIADQNLKIEALIQSPFDEIHATAKREQHIGLKHPAIALPHALYGDARQNSKGFDLADDSSLIALNETAQALQHQVWNSQPLLADASLEFNVTSQAILNTAVHADLVGYVQEATETHVEIALQAAIQAQIGWSGTHKSERAAALKRAADLMEDRMQALMILLCREAGKTYANAIAEVREAVDFLRYYATQIESINESTTIRPLGTVLCISPWNFPLAIFQVRLQLPW